MSSGGSGSRVPAAFEKQMSMASARWDDTASSGSWAQVEREAPQAETSGGMDPVPEETPAQPAAQPQAFTPAKAPPPPPPSSTGAAAASSASSAAPVLQAAQVLVDHANETPASRKLRRQQEQAARRGKRAFRWGNIAPQNLAHNPLNSKLPEHLSQVGAQEGERSVLIVDNRDNRIQSPFQNWLLDEVLTNALSYLNVKSDRHLVRSPSSGYHFNLFMVKTLDSCKVIICGSATCYTHVPCAKWDSLTGEVLSHTAFQPFRWPPMTENSSSWVDVKIKLEGHLLVHLELRGYRSDEDLSIQLWHISDAIHSILSETVFIPSVVITVFQGWRVVAISWEVGGRLYACSEGGIVVALDYPLCHFEVRFVATASPDAFGADADRLELRFLSAGDRLNMAASSAMVPPTWLAISRISGPLLIRNARWCREHGARVECPDQALQLAQLAAIHANWTSKIEASTEEERGPRISAISVESNPANIHLVSESPLFKKEKVMVGAEALALQSHDPLDEIVAGVVPPIVDGPAIQPASRAPKLAPALIGPAAVDVVTAVPVSSARPSVTAPGQSPAPSSWAGGALAPSRRTLEQRRAEPMDYSALTPSAFVQMARGSSAFDRDPWSEPSVVINEIVADVPGGRAQPRSFGPPRPEQFEDV